MRRISLISLSLLAVSCVAVQAPDPSIAAREAARERCARDRDGVLASFEQVGRALEAGGGRGRGRQLKVVAESVAEAQRRYAVVSEEACRAPGQEVVRVGRSTWSSQCLDGVPAALGELSGMLWVPSSEVEPEAASWAAESKALWLAGLMRCDVPTEPAGAPVGLQVSALCERRQEGGTYVAEPVCAGAELVEGDRIKVAIAVDVPAWVYVLSSNGAGQFEVLFPVAAGEDHAAVAGTQVVPGGEVWWELDEVAGVTEHLQVVASSERLAALEELVGGAGAMARGAGPSAAESRTRAWLEPWTTRIYRAEGERTTVEVEGQPREAIWMSARRGSPSVVEFSIGHGARRPPVVSAYVQSVAGARPSAWWRLGDGPSAQVVGLGSMAVPLQVVGARGPEPSAVAGEADGALELVEGGYASASGVGCFGGEALSVGLWVRTRATSGATPVSYATALESNAFVLHAPGNLQVFINGAHVTTGVALNDGSWHHLAVTWRAADGELRVYKDGVATWAGHLSARRGLEAGGSLVLGQDQDCLAGCFERSQAFDGALDELVVFPEVLSASMIKALANAE